MRDPVRSEGAHFVKELPERFNELGLVHPRATELGPPLTAPAVGAGGDLESLPQPDRTRPPPALGRDPPADRQGPPHLGRDPLRAGRDTREAGRDTDLSRHIFADHHLTEEQRQAMMRIYLSFRHENDDVANGSRVIVPEMADRPGTLTTRPKGGVSPGGGARYPPSG